MLQIKNSAQYCTTYGWNVDVNVHAQKHTHRQNLGSLALRYLATRGTDATVHQA